MTTSPAGAGYSGTPLAKKLGIKEGFRVCVRAQPDGYRDLLAPIPAGVRFEATMARDTDIVHLFVKERAALEKQLASALKAAKPDIAIWVSWPKKASQVATDITEDTIREIALPLGLVDTKVCAVDAVWSGLKLVIRKANR